MKNKKLSFALLSVIAAMLVVFGISVCAEDTAYPAMKFGVSDGDIVVFGSGTGDTDASKKYDSPKAFLVLDSKQTSVGDESGMFLLTKDLQKEIKGIPTMYMGSPISTECGYFIKAFSDDEKNLIVSTTTDFSQSIFDGCYYTDYIVDNKAFALSLNEFQKYAAQIKKTSVENSWWLRSYRQWTKADASIGASYIQIYNNAASEKSMSNGEVAYSRFRPALNIKTDGVKVNTPFGMTVLLLPDETSNTSVKTDAQNKMCDVSALLSDTAGQYKLSIKDNAVTDIKIGEANISGRNVWVAVSTNARSEETPVSDNEYISVIITSSDSENANILSYGRFKKTGLTTNLKISVPDNVDMNTAKMYVFNEVYNGEKSGYVSDLTEVCLKHNYSYSGNYDSDGNHFSKCTVCGSLEKNTTAPHEFSYSQISSDTQHKATCTVCGYEKTENHAFNSSPVDNRTHLSACICGYERTSGHNYTTRSDNIKTHSVICSDCNYTVVENHSFISRDNGDGTHHSKCSSCNAEFDLTHDFSLYTDTGNDETHTEVCSGCKTEKTVAHSYTKFKEIGGDTLNHTATCELCSHSMKTAHDFTCVNDGNDTAHLYECPCGYMKREKHSYKYSYENDKEHTAVCKNCAYSKTLEHNQRYVYNENSHELYCEDCEYTWASSEHEYEYTCADFPYIMHKFTCKVCEFSNIGEHEPGYEVSADGSEKAACTLCKYDYAVKKAKNADADYSKRSDAVNTDTVSLLSGSHVSDYVPYYLFADNGKFVVRGVGADDGFCHAAVAFGTYKPVKALGLSVTTAYDAEYTYYRTPSSGVLYGKNGGDDDYKLISYIPFKNLVAAVNSTSYDFIFDVPEDRLSYYSEYKFEIITPYGEMQLGSIALLSAKGTEPVYNLDGVLCQNVGKENFAVPGEDFECIFTSQNGHPKASDVSVKLDNAAFDGYTYSEETGILHIDGSKYNGGKLEISAYAPIKPVNIITDLYRVNFIGEKTAVFGTDYTAVFTDSDGKKTWIPRRGQDISVTVDGKEVFGYSYDYPAGKLFIPGEAITGDITIKAEEYASRKHENTAVGVKTGTDIERFFETAGEASSAVYDAQSKNYDCYVRFYSDVETSYDCFRITDGNVTFDFGGFKYTLSNDTPIEVMGSSTVTLKNGTVEQSAGDYVVYVAENSTVILGNDLEVRSSYHNTEDIAYNYGVMAEDGGKIIINGAKFTNGAVSESASGAASVRISGINSYAEINGGDFSGWIVLEDSNASAKLSGGNFAGIKFAYTGKKDWFGLLADGYCYKSTSGNDRKISDMFAGNFILHVSVEKIPDYITLKTEETKADFGYAQSPVFEAQNIESAEYQWYVGKKAIDGAENSSYTVPAGLEPGDYEYVCIAKTNGIYTPVFRAVFTVYCAHTDIDENGNCHDCGVTYQAAVVSPDDTVAKYYKSIYDAAAALTDGKVLKLLRDVALAEYDGDDYLGSLSINGNNVTFDLNGKVLSVGSGNFNAINSDLGRITLKNGTVKSDIRIGYNVESVYVENLTVTGTLIVRGSDTACTIDSGKFGKVRADYSAPSRYLPYGKAYRSTADGRWLTPEETGGDVSDVEVADAPAVITSQPSDVNLDKNYAPGEKLSVGVKTNYDYTAEDVSYQWLYADKMEDIEGATSADFEIPSGIADGDCVGYICKVTCGGYSIYSSEAIVRVGFQRPKIWVSAYGENSLAVSVDSNGNNFALIIAVYSDKKLIKTKIMDVKSDDDVLFIDMVEKFGMRPNEFEKISFMVFEDLTSMKPLCEPTVIDDLKN